MASFTISTAFLDEAVTMRAGQRLPWRHPMGSGLCDGIDHVRAPPENLPGHYRSRSCNDAPSLQMQCSLNAMRWHTQLGQASLSIERALHTTLCYGCSSREPRRCCNAAAGGGLCLLGVCACYEGWAGLDCGQPVAHVAPYTLPSSSSSAVALASPSASSAAAPASSSSAAAALARSGLAIYVYDVPPALGLLQRARSKPRARQHHLYSTEEAFLSRLLEDTVGGGAARTLDPEAADLFFVPTMQWHTQGNACARASVRLMAHYVRAAFPYWERSGGRDHVFFLTSDGGSCWFDGELGARPILISHWGLLGAHGAMAKTVGRARDFADDATVHRWMSRAQYCYSPQKDVVVPADAGGTDGGRADRPRRFLRQPPADVARSASYLLLHAGGIWQWRNYKSPNRSEPWYSQGVRQALYATYGGARGAAEGVRVVPHSVPAAEWLRAKFCLSASGMGWGIRTGMLLLIGCVPLVVQPYVVQPLEEVLPYPTFSMRHDAFEALSAIPTALRAVNEPRLRAMRRAGARMRPAFSWARAGGLAYNYTILALCHRAVQLRGRLRAAGAGCAAHARPLPGGRPRARRLGWLPPSVARAQEALIEERRQALAALEEERRMAQVVTEAHAREATAPTGLAGAVPSEELRGPRGGGGAARDEPPRHVPTDRIVSGGPLQYASLKPSTGCAAGFCNVTGPDRGRCASGSGPPMGSWRLGGGRGASSINTLADCLAACRRCRRCRYVSFSRSPAHAECSWYSECALARLHPPPREGPDYQTCHVPVSGHA